MSYSFYDSAISQSSTKARVPFFGFANGDLSDIGTKTKAYGSENKRLSQTGQWLWFCLLLIAFIVYHY